MRSGRRAAALFLWVTLAWVSLACAVRLQAEGSPWANAEAYEENDTLVPGALSSDSMYTQGFRLVFMRSPQHQWRFVRRLHDLWRPLLGDDPYRASGGLVFGQNMFTPVEITTFEPDPTDRPYAGYLYAGTRVDLVRTDGNVRHSFELNAGVLGPAAFAKDAQAGLHVLRLHRIPKGWHRQMGTEPGLNLRYLHHRRFGTHFLDVTPGAGLALGTIQTYAAADATLRVGWKMTGMPLAAAPWSAFEDTASKRQRRNWELEFFVGAEARYFLRNAYLDGPLFGDGPEVAKEPLVYDVRCGFSLRRKLWRATYSFVRRSREFAGQAGGAHNFGSVAISRELQPGAFSPPAGPRCFLLSNWNFELGMGRGVGWYEPELPSGRVADGPSGRVGVSKGLTTKPLQEQVRLRDRLSLGVEMAGIAGEGGPPDATGQHRDDFLATTAFTVRLRPFAPTSKPGTLHLRVGAGRATAKRELTRAGPAFVETADSGLGLVVGADYMFRLGGMLSLGLDATWSQLWIDKAVLDRGRFLSGSLVLHLHP